MAVPATPEDRLPQYLSIAEATAVYHISRDYIRHRVMDGTLPAVGSGQRITRVGADELSRLFRAASSMPPK